MQATKAITAASETAPGAEILTALIKYICFARLSFVYAFALFALFIFCFDNNYIPALIFRPNLNGFRDICGCYKTILPSGPATHYPHLLEHLRQFVHRCFALFVDAQPYRMRAAVALEQNYLAGPPAQVPAGSLVAPGLLAKPDLVEACESFPGIQHQSISVHHQKGSQ